MKRVEALLALVSFGVFSAIAWRMNWGVMLRDLEAAAMGIPILIALSLLRLSLTTKSWTLSLTTEGIKPHWKHLIGIRLAAQAIGYLTVFGVAASEPMKISLLREDVTAAAAGTLADSGMYWFSSALFGAAACVYVAVALAGRGHGISLLTIGITFAGSLILLSTRSPLLGQSSRLLGRASPRWLRKSVQLEHTIRHFRVAHSDVARKMFGIDLACQLIQLAETAVILYFIGLPLKLSLLLGIELATRIVKLTTGWLPGRIGADEGGAAAAFMAFGFSPAAGVVLALARRFRDLLWCALGVIWLVWNSQHLMTLKSARKDDSHAGCHCLTES